MHVHRDAGVIVINSATADLKNTSQQIQISIYG